MTDNMQDLVFSSSMVIATLWIVDMYWRIFFERKSKNVPAVVIWIVFGAYQLFFECISGDIHIVITLINMGLFLLIAVYGYESRGSAKYFLLMLFYAVWSLIEVFAFFFVNLLFAEEVVSDSVGVVVSKILMIIFVHELSIARKNRKDSVIPNRYYVFFLLIPLGSICIAINEFYIRGDSFFSMFTISILLLFNVVILEVYTKLNEFFMHEEERVVYAQQVDIIAQNTIAQEKMMEDFYEERHNLINRLIVLKSRIEGDSEKEDILTNIDRMINNSYSLDAISDSGNSTVDAVINFKYAVAKEYGITFKLNLFIPAELPIEQSDIGVILGNALDNAIDAVKQCTAADRSLRISMGIKKEAWIIIITNPYEHRLKTDRNGEFLSTKEDKKRHGFGLNSIRKIAEKYQGEIITEVSNQVFSLMISINLGQI